MQDEELVRVPIRQSLIRPPASRWGRAGTDADGHHDEHCARLHCVELAGGDRRRAALSFFGMQAARRMAKADPQMTKVYRRHVNYRAFYRARSGPKCQG